MPEPRPSPTGHYFSANPEVASNPSTVVLTLPDARFELTTDRGVFSSTKVDPGTRVLLLEAPPPPSGKVTLVDVGCGYGPIALTLARRSPEATIWAVDVNERALELCAENARRAGFADRIRTCTPNEVPADLTVDGIWSNPPIRIGKPALQDLLATWLDRLSIDGTATLVVHKHLGADSLARWLQTRGHAVNRIASRAGYRVLAVSGAVAPTTPTSPAATQHPPEAS